MNRSVVAMGLFGTSLMAVFGLVAGAGAAPLYDVEQLLLQPHPFVPRGDIPSISAPSPPQPGGEIRVAAPDPASPPPASPVAAVPEKNEGWNIISEVRGGILKHSVTLGDTAKEKGVDGNIEVLFNSPDLFDFMWSPRPHIGASFNASDDDTDQVYAGLTWEWEPGASVFLDFSFGFSLHNGNLSNNNGTMGAVANPDESRRREFGCRVLFRESLEGGYRITQNHSLSVMWDHISNGGLCSDENEGMDNVGLRYGYRF